jgi:hypothetical protein
MCHLLVAPFLVRSTSIFKAIAAGKNIVSPLWIISSFNQLKVLDAEDFVLRDVAAEKVFGCNLRHTLVESRLHPIFENICFYVTPNVKPSRHELHSIIEAGGGTIDKAQPSRFTLQKYLEVSILLNTFLLRIKCECMQEILLRPFYFLIFEYKDKI